MYGYIYKTTNIITNKIYIGQKKSDVFLKEKYLGSGVRLNSSIQHHGREDFIVELLDVADSKEELDEKESFWIKELNPKDPNVGYNLTDGGDGVVGGNGAWNKGLTKQQDPRLIQSDDTRRKRSNSLKKAYSEGRHQINYTNDLHEKMSKKAKEREHPPTTKGRISITNGIKNKMIFPNELSIYELQGWYKGKTIKNLNVWNKGLTKEVDSRLAKMSEERKQKFINGESIGCFGIKENTNGFIKGNIPWNKGLKGYNQGHPNYYHGKSKND
jgi:group I intron endonuclease